MPIKIRPLKICLLSYRSNPHCGGQGVYLKNLSRSLKDLGHHVVVISGPPDPELDDDIPLYQLPGLDLYNPEDPFRVPKLKELMDPINLVEWIGVSTMGFPEPFTFGLRAYRFLHSRLQSEHLKRPAFGSKYEKNADHVNRIMQFASNYQISCPQYFNIEADC